MDKFFDQSLDTNTLENFQRLLSEEMANGKISLPPAGLNKQEQEALYATAYGYYGQARYLEALQIFATLLREDLAEARYFKGIAACYQMLGDHENAAAYFGFTYFLNPRDPSSVCHIAQCLLAIGHVEDAREAFNEFIEKSIEVPACSDLRKYAYKVLDSFPIQPMQGKSK
jgi:type III secretion system low calcium response chaperone LcrH/SycD